MKHYFVSCKYLHLTGSKKKICKVVKESTLKIIVPKCILALSEAKDKNLMQNRVTDQLQIFENSYCVVSTYSLYNFGVPRKSSSESNWRLFLFRRLLKENEKVVLDYK